MDDQRILLRVVEVFEQLGIPYMVTGSLAVSYYGMPRATHDFDTVVALSRDQGRKIPDALGEEFYVSDIEDAILQRQMFNLIAQQSRIKIDCWILDEKDRYRSMAFDRRRQIDLWGKKLYFISKEDLIISKLLWYREAQTDVHLNDVRGIIQVQGKALDSQYIADWCDRLSLAQLLSNIKKDMELN